MRGPSRYETLLPIGTGGMATVFVGRARGSDRSGFVALKRAHPHVRADDVLAESMKREARLASRLQHHNVVSVLDVEEDAEDLVLVLDYVEGCTLRSLLTKLERLRELRPRETIRIILDIAAGLHAAHQATDEDGRILGLVHRDVSPSNMLVGVDGVSRISDFGIAKALFEGSDRTETGVLKGKTSYMAPEYVLYQHANAASDLFSLAVIAWEALADTRLFKGATEIETLSHVIAAEIRPLSSERPELAVLDLVLSKALSRLPSDRHASVEEFALDLEAAARQSDLVATHGEVGALVARLAGSELEERRHALGDDLETVIAEIPQQLGERDDNTTSPLLSDLDPTPLAPAAKPRKSWGWRPNPLGRPQPPPTLPFGRLSSKSGRTVRALRRRHRETMALVGAFAFLALALTAMAIRVRNTAPVDGAHAPSPSGSAIEGPSSPGFVSSSPSASGSARFRHRTPAPRRTSSPSPKAPLP